MREIRTSGSEGGGAGNSTSPSYPYHIIYKATTQYEGGFANCSNNILEDQFYICKAIIDVQAGDMGNTLTD